MRQFVLNLDKSQRRPVIVMNNLTALIDTGAYLPVWTDSEEILKEDLGGVLVKENVTFSGFGGDTKGNMYQVTLQLGDLIFPNMHVIACNELDVSYNMIISATMFYGLIYEINTCTNKITITVPNPDELVRNITVEDKNGRLYVLQNHMK